MHKSVKRLVLPTTGAIVAGVALTLFLRATTDLQASPYSWLIVVGLVVATIAFTLWRDYASKGKTDGDTKTQKQSAGKNSHNLQAGRDIRYNDTPGRGNSKRRST